MAVLYFPGVVVNHHGIWGRWGPVVKAADFGISLAAGESQPGYSRQTSAELLNLSLCLDAAPATGLIV